MKNKANFIFKSVNGYFMPVFILIFFSLIFFIPVSVFAKKINIDLKKHEAMGGHTISRHVGKSDQDLINRLKKNKKISAASTFKTIGDAEKAIEKTIEKNYKKFKEWLKTARKGERLVLKGSGKGKGISRKDFKKAMKSENPEKALSDAIKKRSKCKVIIKADGKGGFFVLTAYPE